MHIEPVNGTVLDLAGISSYILNHTRHIRAYFAGDMIVAMVTSGQKANLRHWIARQEKKQPDHDLYNPLIHDRASRRRLFRVSWTPGKKVLFGALETPNWDQIFGELTTRKFSNVEEDDGPEDAEQETAGAPEESLLTD